MTLMEIVLLISPAILGLFLTWIIFDDTNSPADWILLVIIGTGTGIGISSAFYFIWSLVFSPDYRLDIFFGFEIAAIIILGSVAAIRVKKKSHKWKMEPIGWGPVLFCGLLAAIIFLAVTSFLNSVRMMPRGIWDGLAIWNMHARFLFLGKTHWLDVFNPIMGTSHPDYPYLLPGFVALEWSIIGRARTVVPLLVAGFFTFANIGLLFGIFWKLRDIKQAALAAIVLGSAPAYILNGSGSTADVPLSFYYLVVCILTVLALREDKLRKGVLFLLGISLGFAIWTKNDGCDFLVAFFLSWFIVAWIKKDFKKTIKELEWILVGLAPILVLFLYFKFMIAPPDDMAIVVAQGIRGVSSKLFSVSRYAQTLQSLLTELWLLGGWRFSLVIILVGYVLLTGFVDPIRKSRETWTVGFLLASSLIGYFFVYILTPHDLTWHLRTSMGRLLLQLLPGAIFFTFYITKSLPPYNEIIGAIRSLRKNSINSTPPTS